MLKIAQIRIGEKLDALGAFPRKAVEYLVVFALLGLVYVHYLKARMQGGSTITIGIDLEHLLVVLKFFVLAGGPLALVRWLDDNWRDQDTAIVCILAYLASNSYWIHRTGCPLCVFSEAMLLVPYFFAAVVGHKLGGRRKDLE